MANPGGNNGFDLSWTAVTLEKTGDCQGFECARVVTKRCDRSLGHELCNDQHFCIDESLKCNEVPNCGASDHSDENKCLSYIIRYVGIVCGCLVIIIIIIVVVVCCYRKRCNRDRVKYSVPLTHSMTHSIMSTQSSSVPVRSLEHSPRSSCVMYTTSFTDCGISDHVTTPNHNGKSNSVNVLNSFSHSNSFHQPEPNKEPETDDTKCVTKEDAKEGASYKGHQKRPSYHMMRELCYEDGNIVLADL